jgi:hypothetical protein
MPVMVMSAAGDENAAVQAEAASYQHQGQTRISQSTPENCLVSHGRFLV